MSLTNREFWTVMHGMILGAIYLLAFGGGLAGLYSLRQWELTREGMRERMLRLHIGLWVMALMCWITVISGTYIVYPWYRSVAAGSPKLLLLADPNKAAWHTFGMEWKEHVAWIAPILSTTVAMIVLRYREELARRDDIRRASIALYVLAFFAAAVAGVFGAFINKAAPTL